jgi:probable rRNA maturation factor
MIREIFCDNRSGADIGSEVYAYIEETAHALLEGYHFDNGYQLSVSFVGGEEIQSLNAMYRNMDNVTDVLSFPLDEKDGRGVDILGDVVICLPQALAQAAEYGHSAAREISYLTAHSILHLLGYDHENEADKAEMRAAEEQVMEKLQLRRGGIDEKLIKSFKHAADGIRYIYKSQPNFTIHTICALIALFLAALLKFNIAEWALAIVVIGQVLAAEAFNTALERAVDCAGEAKSEKAKQAKDSAAAAVMILAAAAAAVGVLLYLIKIIQIIRG